MVSVFIGEFVTTLIISAALPLENLVDMSGAADDVNNKMGDGSPEDEDIEESDHLISQVVMGLENLDLDLIWRLLFYLHEASDMDIIDIDNIDDDHKGVNNEEKGNVVNDNGNDDNEMMATAVTMHPETLPE